MLGMEARWGIGVLDGWRDGKGVTQKMQKTKAAKKGEHGKQSKGTLRVCI